MAESQSGVDAVMSDAFVTVLGATRGSGRVHEEENWGHYGPYTQMVEKVIEKMRLLDTRQTDILLKRRKQDVYALDFAVQLLQQHGRHEWFAHAEAAVDEYLETVSRGVLDRARNYIAYQMSQGLGLDAKSRQYLQGMWERV
jgi:hypothetical protein